MSNRILELRNANKLSQAQLAQASGLSQATISRLESSESVPSDVRILVKIAKGLGVPLNELRPDDEVAARELFYAFCPNPFCPENKTEMGPKGSAAVRWTSSRAYPTFEFEEVNFCHECGTQLVKDCPDCGKRLEQRYTKYCIKCGREICNRPTQQDWAEIRRIHNEGEPEAAPPLGHPEED